MISLKSDQMTASWPGDSLTFSWDIFKLYTKLKTFVKEFIDFMISLESDKITSLWPNDRLTFTLSDLTPECGTIIQLSAFY